MTHRGPGATGTPSAAKRRGRALPQALWRGVQLVSSREIVTVSPARSLTAGRMLAGYRRGQFPRPRQRLRLLMPWYSPDPRAVLYVSDIHMSKNVRRRLRNSGWTTSVDEAFDEVLARCARRRVVWLTPTLRRAYRDLHVLGEAHSLEVWSADGQLIGGCLGVQVGGVWCGDSMFFDEPDASKVALIDLSERLRSAGGILQECQYLTPHLASMGATTISRADYVELIHRQRDRTITLPTERLPVSRLVEPG